MLARRLQTVVFAGVAVAVLVVHALPAHAQTASCTIFEIKASNDAGGLDPALKPLKNKFKKPPFSAWKTFKLLKQHDKDIELKKAFNLKLITGGKLSLLYRARNKDKDKKVRLRIRFSLDNKKGKRQTDGTVNLDSGDWAIIGGDDVDGGTYIVAFSCSAP